MLGPFVPNLTSEIWDEFDGAAGAGRFQVVGSNTLAIVGPAKAAKPEIASVVTVACHGAAHPTMAS
jgi:hypothetical protein